MAIVGDYLSQSEVHIEMISPIWRGRPLTSNPYKQIMLCICKYVYVFAWIYVCLSYLAGLAELDCLAGT